MSASNYSAIGGERIFGDQIRSQNGLALSPSWFSPICSVSFVSTLNSVVRLEVSLLILHIQMHADIRQTNASPLPTLMLIFSPLVMAAISIANIVKTSLGPVGLDKMLVDDVGVCTDSSMAMIYFLLLFSPTQMRLKYNTHAHNCVNF